MVVPTLPPSPDGAASSQSKQLQAVANSQQLLFSASDHFDSVLTEQAAIKGESSLGQKSLREKEDCPLILGSLKLIWGERLQVLGEAACWQRDTLLSH